MGVRMEGARGRGDGPPDLPSVRSALRTTLQAHGFTIASDSLGMKGELYVVGENDRARALFEFKSTPAEAADTMYQGHWTSDLPLRVAVLPDSGGSARDDGWMLDVLQQAGIRTLHFYGVEGAVSFHGLRELIDDIDARG